MLYSAIVMCIWTDLYSYTNIGLQTEIDIGPTQPPIKLSPHIYNTGPYVIKNIGQQQVIFNPSRSLKRVELSIQVNISAVKPTCSLFLRTSYTGWLAWLHKRTLVSPKQSKRDVTVILRTRLGVLNSIDVEILTNKFDNKLFA